MKQPPGRTKCLDFTFHICFVSYSTQKLFRREMKPPFRPAVARPDDTFYFDSEFTSRTPKGQRSKLKAALRQCAACCVIPSQIRLTRVCGWKWEPVECVQCADIL